MSTSVTPTVFANPDPVAAYRAVYDALSDAYWQASTIDSKDSVHSAMEAVQALITQMDQADLESDTGSLAPFGLQIKHVNSELAGIENQINSITKNLNTVDTVLSTIGKAVSLFP